MKKIVFIGFLVLLIMVVGILLITMLGSKEYQLKEGKVCFNNHCFSVEVAETRVQQEKGLMFQKSLEEKRGMLFVFDHEGNYPFWMMNTKIPLDMIWLNRNQEIVFIEKNAQPCRDECNLINPEQSAQYVLEISGGLSDTIGLKLGDKAMILVDNK